MFNRNYIALSYYQREIKQSITRTKLLAELESKLILTDIKNCDLRDEVVQLKMENKLLKQKLQSKPEPVANQKRTLNESALSRANQLLRSKMFGDSFQTSGDQRLPLKANETYYLDKRNNKHKLNYSCYPQSQEKLTKQVYYEHNEQPSFFAQKKQNKRSLPNHKREFSFKQQDQIYHLSQMKLSESKQVMQKSRGLGSHTKQRLEEKQQPQISDQLKRWKSDGNFGNQSELLFGSKANQMGKRKTFLSIVSVSSKGKKL